MISPQDVVLLTIAIPLCLISGALGLGLAAMVLDAFDHIGGDR